MRTLAMLATMAALSAAPGAARACPTAADLDRGIRFQVDDTATEVFRRLSGTRVQSDYGGDGFVSRTILVKGLYLAELVDVEDGAPVPRTRTTYGLPDASDLSEPVPGESFRVSVRSDGPDGTETEDQIYTFGRAATVNFGACAYDMVPVDLSYVGSDVREVLHYLPQLGIAYVAEYHDDDVDEHYTYYRIEAVK